MNEESYSAAVKLVSQTYVEQGRNAHRTQQNLVRELIEKVQELIPCHTSRGCIALLYRERYLRKVGRITGLKCC